MICEVCGHAAFHAASVSKTFTVDGKLIWVEGIPADVCDHCGEASFHADVAERLRCLVREPHQPKRTVQAEVLQYHAA